MKPWTIQLPRFKCPVCGSEMKISFRGRWRLPRLKKNQKAEERGLDRGEEAPLDGDGLEEDEEIPLQPVPKEGD